MAVAAPKRRSSAVPAPAPSRTAPPKRRKAAPDSPIRVRRTKGSAAAPARVPARTAPPRRKPARKAPARAPKRHSAQPKLALVVGRTAAGVRHLPDSGPIVRMTRGRSWIAVLGVLLAGIVALNVVTLSFAASAGKLDEQITTLEEENSMLGNKAATKFSQDRVRHEAAAQGLVMSTEAEPSVIEYQPKDVEVAAERLAGAG
jgi:hypothetical protein